MRTPKIPGKRTYGTGIRLGEWYKDEPSAVADLYKVAKMAADNLRLNPQDYKIEISRTLDDDGEDVIVAILVTDIKE